MAERSTMRSGEATSFYDRVFETEMNLAIVKTKEAYVAAAYKTAVKVRSALLMSSADTDSTASTSCSWRATRTETRRRRRAA